MMEHYEIPSQDTARETVADEINNFSEADNGGVSPEVVYVRVKLKGKVYMCCSVFNIMFCNCLFLGFAALVCSLKVSEITTLLSRITCQSILKFTPFYQVFLYCFKGEKQDESGRHGEGSGVQSTCV